MSIGGLFEGAAGVFAAEEARGSARKTKQLSQQNIALLNQETKRAIAIRRLQGRLLEGRQRSAFAGGGVRVGTGTPLSVLFDTEATTAGAVRSIRRRSELLAAGFQIQGRLGVKDLETQRTVSLIGAAGATGQAIEDAVMSSAAAGACWVAAEFYGWGTPDWHAARRWILERWEGRTADAFRAVYLRHGPRIAGWVRHYPPVRWLLRPIFAWARRKGV